MKNNTFTDWIVSCGCFASTTLLLIAQVTCFADVIPPNRITTWQGNVGVEGGIPNVTTIYTTLPASATLVQINAAIAACPSNQVVLLSAGTYTLAGQIIFNGKNGVVLRGAGSTATILNFTGSPYLANILVQGSSQSVIWSGVSGSVDWVNGYTQGTNVITVASTSGLSVGMMVGLDQLNDGVDVNKSNAWETTAQSAPGCSGLPGCTDCSRSCGSRAQEQWVKITAISGNNLTISPPLAMPNWKSSQSPQVFWVTGLAQKNGIENMALVGTQSNPGSGYGANITLWNAWNCWVKNINSTNDTSAANPSSHVHIQQSGRCQVEHCYFYGTKASSSMSYGALILMSSFCLIENTIFNKIYAPGMFDYAASCNVWGYNYATNMYDGDGQTVMAATIWFHGSHACMNLIEGVYGNQFRGDYFHGSSSHNTSFRCRWTGQEPGKTSQLYPINLTVTNHYYNLVGNILGTVGTQTTADSISASAVTGYGNGSAVYYVGWNNPGINANLLSDPVTGSTLYRHGNYDVVNGGIVWNATNSDHAIPASMYLASKPSFWGANQPWPPYEPETPLAASVTNIPAGYRFVFGIDPPSGGPDTNAPVISLVSVSLLTNTSATITWTTSEPATSIVKDGATIAYGTSATNSSLVLLHSLTITGLSPGSTNHFQVLSADGSGNLATGLDGTFTMPPPPPPTGLRVISP